MQLHIRFSTRTRLLGLVSLLLGISLLAGCHVTAVKAASNAAQLTFATSEEAGLALETAARSNDEKGLAQILGPESKQILSSGDAVEDKTALASFAAKYDRMNRWVAMTDGSRILYIGADNYPYPIPLTQDTSSRWYFNTEAGKDEILARRIGKNELLAIDAISAMARAEELYYEHFYSDGRTHQYALRVLSRPGKKDGLYWEIAADQPSSPLGRLNEFARDIVESTQSDEPPVFDGYSFRILTAQADHAKGGAKSYLENGAMTGGFAILATPVTYGDSGIMTFMISSDGVVYQKDMGPNTTEIAGYIYSYDPDISWTAE